MFRILGVDDLPAKVVFMIVQLTLFLPVWFPQLGWSREQLAEWHGSLLKFDTFSNLE